MKLVNLLLSTSLFAILGACAHGPKSAQNEVWTERSPAAECIRQGNYRECKNARTSDPADQYLLENDGDLFRAIGNQLCQITSGVTEFKISQHRDDAAVLYYLKDNDLYVVHPQATTGGNCPPVSKKKIMDDVDKYSVVSNTNSTIVNVALNKSGRLVAWDNTHPVYEDTGVSEYLMNQCFGTRGKSFSSYVLFSIDRSGVVTKVKVEDGASRYNQSRDTNANYRSIQDFKERENVCE
jgi:hypothetical protein